MNAVPRNQIPKPPPVRKPPVPPRFNSIYNVLTVRLRKANTIFQDRVKLVLTQTDNEHWSVLPKPYLLVVPTQNRQPIKIDIDTPSFISPRVVSLIAQFDDFGSEGSHLVANEIDAAERQLVMVLAQWQPQGIPGSLNGFRSAYKPTEYAGMRVVGTREPAVKVSYTFIFKEEVSLGMEAPIVDEMEIPEGMLPGNIDVSVFGPCCVPEPVINDCQLPSFSVSSGKHCIDEDVCEPECPTVMGE